MEAQSHRLQKRAEHSVPPGKYSRQKTSVSTSGGREICDGMTQVGDKAKELFCQLPSFVEESDHCRS